VYVSFDKEPARARNSPRPRDHQRGRSTAAIEKAVTTDRRDGWDLFSLANNGGEITMIRNIWITLSLGLGACTTNQAPGTRPIDMSAQAHLQECKKHLAIAQEQYQRAGYMARVRGYITAAHAGDREEDIAKQHGQAAKALDPTASSCP
jgi:hypothetical protein